MFINFLSLPARDRERKKVMNKSIVFANDGHLSLQISPISSYYPCSSPSSLFMYDGFSFPSIFLLPFLLLLVSRSSSILNPGQSTSAPREPWGVPGCPLLSLEGRFGSPVGARRATKRNQRGSRCTPKASYGAPRELTGLWRACGEPVESELSAPLKF